MKTIRYNTFETNSSSAHSLTIFSKKNWEDFKQNKLFLVGHLPDKDNSCVLKTIEDIYDEIKNDKIYDKMDDSLKEEFTIENLKKEVLECVNLYNTDSDLLSYLLDHDYSINTYESSFNSSEFNYGIYDGEDYLNVNGPLFVQDSVVVLGDFAY